MMFWGMCLNDAGDVAGFWALFGQRPRQGSFIERAGKLRLLRTRFGIVALNSRQQMVGQRPVMGVSLFEWYHPGVFMYQHGRPRQILGRRFLKRLGLPPWVEIVATGINDLAQVTGYVYEQNWGGGTYVGFLWHAGRVRLLEARLPSNTHERDSRPHGINNSGLIVGEKLIEDPHGREHAFSWRNGKMGDLGTFGGKNSGALGVNDRGDIIGWSELPDGRRHAFLYRGGKMMDLNALVNPRPTVVLEEAAGINRSGQIIANGHAKSGRNVAFLLRPVA